MANMKELLVEITSQVLVRKYGSLNETTSKVLLQNFEAANFVVAGDTREAAQRANSAPELVKGEVFGRTLRMLHYVCQQFWEDKKQSLLSTSRLRTLLLKREIAASIKELVWQTNDRTGLDKPWKPEGVTFVQSLPPLPKGN
jgi:phenylpyruvate tautomerase PptA (4-oxalocrotonate tautomerase family)